jgi:hypothetical protein
MRTALFWAKYGGKPIVLIDNLKFYTNSVAATPRRQPGTAAP